jgi:hypothetical protein
VYTTVDSPQSNHPPDPEKSVTVRTCTLQKRIYLYESASVAAPVNEELFDLEKPALIMVDCNCAGQ